MDQSEVTPAPLTFIDGSGSFDRRREPIDLHDKRMDALG